MASPAHKWSATGARPPDPNEKGFNFSNCFLDACAMILSNTGVNVCEEQGDDTGLSEGDE
jgi:hypothetical protein